MPDDFFKKLPKFGKINIGTIEVHKCKKDLWCSKFGLDFTSFFKFALFKFDSLLFSIVPLDLKKLPKPLSTSGRKVGHDEPESNANED